mmetsp:Transcript_28484/g.51510  ORF Transcript_28484/g.51510 Transcript_28484/m.51510 type:complete len:133 (-) Transcript_28484:43-441(-)
MNWQVFIFAAAAAFAKELGQTDNTPFDDLWHPPAPINPLKDCTPLDRVPFCEMSSKTECPSTYMIKNFTGYLCQWDTTLFPPTCVTYEKDSKTPLCKSGSCGGPPVLPELCWNELPHIAHLFDPDEFALKFR